MTRDVSGTIVLNKYNSSAGVTRSVYLWSQNRMINVYYCLLLDLFICFCLCRAVLFEKVPFFPLRNQTYHLNYFHFSNSNRNIWVPKKKMKLQICAVLVGNHLIIQVLILQLPARICSLFSNPNREVDSVIFCYYRGC